MAEQELYRNKDFPTKLACSKPFVEKIIQQLLLPNGFAVRNGDDSPFIDNAGNMYRRTDLEALHCKTWLDFYIEIKEIGRTGAWEFQGLSQQYVDPLCQRLGTDRLERTIIIWIDNFENPFNWRITNRKKTLEQVFNEMNPKFCQLNNGKIFFVPYCQTLPVLMKNREVRYEGINPRTGKLYIPCKLKGQYFNTQQYIWPLVCMEPAVEFFRKLNASLALSK